MTTEDMKTNLQTMADNCVKAVMFTDVEAQVELMNLLGDFSKRHMERCYRLIAEAKARLN